MQPRLFASPAAGPLTGAAALIRRGLLHTVSGAVLVVLARLAWTGLDSRLLASLLLLPGLSLMLHFGVCNIVAGAWRLRGVPCEALFRAPLRSQNLGEFWAKRWNVAFSEMTAIAVYRPLAARLGRGPALLSGFALSGLLHELAISVPVGAGFGLPLLYFLVHGGLVLAERRLVACRTPAHRLDRTALGVLLGARAAADPLPSALSCGRHLAAHWHAVRLKHTRCRSTRSGWRFCLRAPQACSRRSPAPGRYRPW